MAKFSENRHISNLINMSCKVVAKLTYFQSAKHPLSIETRIIPNTHIHQLMNYCLIFLLLTACNQSSNLLMQDLPVSLYQYLHKLDVT